MISSEKVPLITIGITCFNAGDTIGRAIDNALVQDWPEFEVLVVDDGSTDNSLKIIEEKTADDSRIRLVRHKENKGFPSALNTIISKSKGELIAFFDDDDVSKPDRLRRQYERLSAYEGGNTKLPALCYTNREVLAPDGRKDFVYAIGRNAPEPHGQMVADYLLWHYAPSPYVWGQFGSCTLMVRKYTLEELGGFDKKFRRCAEWDLAIRLAQEGGHFIAVDATLVVQHITPTADKSGSVPLKYALMLRNKYQSYLKGLYLPSVFIAFSRFHYARGHSWRSRAYLALACLLSPHRVGVNEWRKRKRR
jgi:glycosyltransferase involved in cell wall biosynthesis